MQQVLEKPFTKPEDFLSFLVGKQSFCLSISNIFEIRRWTPATLLPHAPSHVLGVINLRGSVVPIYDLSDKLGFGKVEPHTRSVTMIVSQDAQTIGLLVDSVSEILTVDPADMQNKPDIEEDTTNHIKGFFIHGDDIVRVIDLPTVITPINTVSGQ